MVDRNWACRVPRRGQARHRTSRTQSEACVDDSEVNPYAAHATEKSEAANCDQKMQPLLLQRHVPVTISPRQPSAREHGAGRARDNTTEPISVPTTSSVGGDPMNQLQAQTKGSSGPGWRWEARVKGFESAGVRARRKEMLTDEFGVCVRVVDGAAGEGGTGGQALFHRAAPRIELQLQREECGWDEGHPVQGIPHLDPARGIPFLDPVQEIPYLHCGLGIRMASALLLVQLESSLTQPAVNSVQQCR